MAGGHDEDLMPEDNSGYKLSQPKQSLAEYQKMGMLSPLSFAFWFFFFPQNRLNLLSPASPLHYYADQWKLEKGEPRVR